MWWGIENIKKKLHLYAKWKFLEKFPRGNLSLAHKKKPPRERMSDVWEVGCVREGKKGRVGGPREAPRWREIDDSIPNTTPFTHNPECGRNAELNKHPPPPPLFLPDNTSEHSSFR